MKDTVSASFKGVQWKGNVYVGLFLHMVLMMVLYSICRVAFYFFNTDYFPGISFQHFLRLMWGGFRFDLAALLYVNSAFILFYILPFNWRFERLPQRVASVFFLVTNGLALLANVADMVYYRFTLRRTTAEVFAQFQNETNGGKLIFLFLIDYWYAVVFWLLLMALMIFFHKRIRMEGPKLKNKISYYGSSFIGMLVIIYFVIIGIRGGFMGSTRPITLSNAGDYVNRPQEISLVLNTPFAFLRTLGEKAINRVAYFDDAEIASIYSPVIIPHDTSAFRADNVVIIILESFSREFFGFYNKEKENGTYKGYTPFLDSLISNSLTFEWSFANGRKSIDGLPSVVSSMPSLSVPYFLTPYSGNTINSLGTLLKAKGYHTSFFHGAPNGSMGFSAFMNIAGFDEYYGLDEYGNDDDFDGIWGIWDGKFFPFFADQLNTFPEPFVSTIFSVSSHHPFKIPAEYETKFKGGPLVIHKGIQYTDNALRDFFNKASVMPWYKNTLFVITADHTSSEIQFDVSRTAAGLYSVPVVFFKGDNSLAAFQPKIAQQIDIMPTVLGYLHYEKPYVAFGRNQLDATQDPFAFNYKDNVYQLTQDDYLLQFDGTKSVALYNFKEDKLLTHNLVSDSANVTERLETKIKAIIQHYNNRMIDNDLTVE